MADVTNYTIENASGANVRSDLNNVFAAIQSNNSKSTDLASSQCVAGMPFLNTTTNTLKIRNSSNNGFTEIGNIDQANLGLLSKSGGTMTGQLLIDDSNSASAPALSFDTDTDLGLFRKASNVMSFASDGIEQIQFGAFGTRLLGQNEIQFADADSSHHLSLRAPSTVASSKTITLPDEAGTVLTNASSISSAQISGNLFQLGGNQLVVGQVLRALSEMNNITPQTNDSFDLGGTNLRWRNIYTNDLNLSNEGKKNDVDGTWGSYTIQEGHEDLFLINHKTNKKFKFVLQEVIS